MCLAAFLDPSLGAFPSHLKCHAAGGANLRPSAYDVNATRAEAANAEEGKDLRPAGRESKKAQERSDREKDREGGKKVEMKRDARPPCLLFF